MAERESEVKALKKRIAELEKELTLDKVASELKGSSGAILASL